MKSTITRRDFLDGWPLFFLIAALTFACMMAGQRIQKTGSLGT